MSGQFIELVGFVLAFETFDTEVIGVTGRFVDSEGESTLGEII